MQAESFCYWLQGWFELNKTIDHREGATPETMKMIEEHLQLVFEKVTSSISEQKFPVVQYPDFNSPRLENPNGLRPQQYC